MKAGERISCDAEAAIFQRSFLQGLGMGRARDKKHSIAMCFCNAWERARAPCTHRQPDRREKSRSLCS